MKQRLTGFSELGYAQTHAPFQVIGNRMAQHAPALAYKIILAVVAWCMLAPAWATPAEVLRAASSPAPASSFAGSSSAPPAWSVSGLKRCMSDVGQGVVSNKRLPPEETRSICECLAGYGANVQESMTGVPRDVRLVMCARSSMQRDWYESALRTEGRRLRREGWASQDIHRHALCMADAVYETYVDGMLRGATPKQELADKASQCLDLTYLVQRYAER